MRVFRPLRRVLPLLAVLIAAGCGSDSPTGVMEGEQMSVGEQVVIEAAIDRLADSAEVRGRTPQDSLLADFLRIAARLVRLQGRQGTITVTNPVTASAPIEMHAAAFIGIDGSAAGLPNVHLLVTWSGLDDLHGTVERALVVMADDPQETGTFSLPGTSTTDVVRYMDFTPGGGFFFNASGTITVSAPAFSSGCTGLPNVGGATCGFGHETVEGTAVISKDDGVTTPSITFGPATLPAFRVTATVF